MNPTPQTKPPTDMPTTWDELVKHFDERGARGIAPLAAAIYFECDDPAIKIDALRLIHTALQP